MSDNKEFNNFARTIRFCKDKSFSDHTPEGVIARNTNQFEGWHCSVGTNGLFIDWTGHVYPGTCLIYPEYSYGNIESGFQLKKSWFVCQQKNCQCNIEISLPKFNPANQSSEQLDELRLLASQVDMSSYNESPSVQPDVVVPALEWDRKFKYVMWALGRRCNYSCSYCDDNAHSKTDPFFSRDSLFKTVDYLQNNFSDGKIIRYAFTGGEPCLHPDFMDLVKSIDAQGNVAGVTTNGSRTADYYCELLEHSTINFSVHFQFINLERFYKVINAILDKKKTSEHLRNRWVDIRIMIPPGYWPQATELVKNLKMIDGFEEMIFYSFVPVRAPNSSRMMDYDPEELLKIQKGML